MIEYFHSIKVYYRDIDKMGIVYYSRYFEYFEESADIGPKAGFQA